MNKKMGFLYDIKKNGDKYVLSIYFEPDDNPIIPEKFKVKEGYWEDYLIEDDLIKNEFFCGDQGVIWRSNVNEVGKTYYGANVFRFGDLCGFYDQNGLGEFLFNAITTDTLIGNTVIAKFKRNVDCNYPNYIWNRGYALEYYIINESGVFIPIKDNGESFRAKDHTWFPRDFKEAHGLIEYIDYNYTNFHEENEWTDEDAWDAMTDGMYGDYHGSGWDPEDFGY